MNKKRLSIAAIAVCGAMLIAHIGFTVAWYNGSSSLAVYNFDITLADKELDISTDNEEFKPELTREDLEEWIPKRYRPVSSAFSDEWLDQKSEQPQFTSFYYGEPEKLAYNSFTDVGVVNEGYFQKELYLRCDSYAKVSIDMERSYVKSDTETNKKTAEKLHDRVYPNKSVEEIEGNLNDIEKSLRFSLLVLNDTGKEVGDDYNYQIFDPFKNGSTNLGGVLDTDLNGYYDSYKGKEVIYGEVALPEGDSTLVHGNAINEEGDLGPSNSSDCFVANHQKNVQPLDIASSVSNGMSIKEEEALSRDHFEDFSFTLQENVSKKIVLSIYIEGWDRDNVNYTMYSSFLTSICFKLADSGNGGN